MISTRGTRWCIWR
jgi:hypothetical protein